VSFRRRSEAFLVTLAAVVGLSCGDSGSGEESVVVAVGGDADILVPLLWSESQARIYTELMFEKLADIGPGQSSVGDGDYEPRLAKSWSWSADSLAISFSLDPRARWHDGRPVRAGDVRFSFQVFTDPKVASSPGADLARALDSITVVDSLTAKAWFKARSPEQFHSLAYNLVPIPEHLLASIPRDSLRQSGFAKNPVGNGPFRFVSWEKNRRIEFAAFDSFARGRPKLDRLIFTVTGDAASAARAVLAGDADFIETLSIDEVAEFVKHAELKLVPIRAYDYGFMSFNLRTPDGKSPHPIFASTEVRRALTMATDRAAMVKNVHDTLGRQGLGPFTRRQWTADTTLPPLPYDVAAAERTLDSLGWKRGADSVRAKDGRPLAFTIVVLSSNRVRVRYAELMQQAFRRIGVKAAIDLVDSPAFRAKLTSHDFEATIFTWRSTPSASGTRQTWGSRSFQAGSPFNAGGYRNAVFDAQVDSGLAARDLASARKHFREAYRAAIEDPPAIWIYEPFLVAGASTRVVTGALRPDAWWQSIPTWDVTGPARRRPGSSSQ
jgi:peptide/nickel transport system substrate-binding protein